MMVQIKPHPHPYIHTRKQYMLSKWARNMFNFPSYPLTYKSPHALIFCSRPLAHTQHITSSGPAEKTQAKVDQTHCVMTSRLKPTMFLLTSTNKQIKVTKWRKEGEIKWKLCEKERDDRESDTLWKLLSYSCTAHWSLWVQLLRSSQSAISEHDCGFVCACVCVLCTVYTLHLWPTTVHQFILISWIILLCRKQCWGKGQACLHNSQILVT